MASKKRILMLVAPKDFYEPEYFAPRKLFVDEGFDVDVVSGEGAASGTQGTQIAAGSVSDADQADFDGLFVVGGKGMIDFSDDANAQRVLRKFLRAKKPVALICHAPLLAAKAKAAAGKDVTGWPDIQKDMEKAGAKWTGMPVERDGFLFTAVGPDDAESLAFALASAVKGEKMLARSEALLDTSAAFRKLAAIHRVARMISMGMDEDDDILRELERIEQAEGLDPELERAAPAPVRPPAEPPPSAALPAKPEAEAPETLKAPPAIPEAAPPRPSPSADIRFSPPRTDGSWPEMPPAPPAGFPLPPITIGGNDEARQKNRDDLTALFAKQETLDAVREAARHPPKKAALQEYLVPAMVLLIGKEWWERNKRRPNLKGAPFRLFPKELYDEFRTKNINETIGRPIIAQINMEIAHLLSVAVSTLNAGGNLPGYLYKGLNNNMVAFAGKSQGFELYKQAACAYCRWKLNRPSMPPKLQLMHTHDMRGMGLGSGLSQRMIYKCPDCADLIPTLGLLAQRLESDIASNQENLRFLESKLEVHPKDEESRNAAEGLRGVISSNKDSLQEVRKDVDARKRLAQIPYQHLVCINPDCPGVKIPLTFIDWDDESWQSGPAGKRRVKMIADVFDVRKPEEAETASADDGPGPGRAVAPVKPIGSWAPPPWLQNVPFICPYDGKRFTPAEAFGKGYIGEDGRPMGGLLVDAVRTNLWRQPTGAPTKMDPETAERRQKRTKSDDAEAMFYRHMVPSIRMELLRKKDEYLSYKKEKGPGGARSRQTNERMEDLYDAVLEWSLDNPEDLLGYFVGRMPTEYTRNRRDEHGNIVQHKAIGRWHKKPVNDTIAAILQAWLHKMLERHGNDIGTLLDDKRGAGISKWFTNPREDNMPADACFIAKVEGAAEGSRLLIRCPLRYGEKTPLGPVRRGSVTKRPVMALLRGVWKYPGSASANEMKGPVSVENAASVMSGTNMLHEVDRYDFSDIVINASMTSLNPGDLVLCRALFMPGSRAWYPRRLIMGLRKDFNEDNDFMETIGRIADGSEEDEEVFDEWIGLHKQYGLPGLLEDFDRRIMEKRRKKE